MMKQNNLDENFLYELDLDRGNIELLYNAIQEIAHETDSSTSLLFLEMGLKYSVYSGILNEFLEYLEHKDNNGVKYYHKSTNDIKYMDLVKIIRKAFPEDREVTYLMINNIILSFAKSNFPELSILATEIETAQLYTIEKHFDPSLLEDN